MRDLDSSLRTMPVTPRNAVSFVGWLHAWGRELGARVVKCLLPGIGAALLAALPTAAGTWNAYGPVQYTRGTGTPVTVTNTFAVLNPNTQYTLHVVNGGLQDSSDELVSSSVISVNGVQVLGQNNFNQNVSVLDVPLTLQPSNTISVELWGQPGGTISVQVLGVDNDPPVINAAASPAPNAAGWNNTSVTVSFTCSDATSGVATCPPAQTATTEGPAQVVSGTATDNAGNAASASVALNIDLTPPSLVVTSPANGATLSGNSVTVTGSATDAVSGIASVTCNGSPASLTDTGFSCTSAWCPARTQFWSRPPTWQGIRLLSPSRFQSRQVAG